MARARATGAARSCRRPRDRLPSLSGGFEAAIAADRQFAEGILEQLPVALLLPRRCLGLPFAGDLVIGGARDRGEIVEVGAQRLPAASDRSRGTAGVIAEPVGLVAPAPR